MAHGKAKFEGVKPELIPPLPAEIAHVWNFFTDIFNPGGIGMGPYRTEFREIEAYSRVMRIIIQPREAFLIRALAELFMIVQSRKKSGGDVKNQTSMTDSQGLKAMFSRQGKRPKSKKK